MASPGMRIVLDNACARVRFCASPLEEGARAFVWYVERRAAVLLVDMRQGNCGTSVTNAVGKFVAFVQRQEIGRRGIAWEDVRWFYRDSEGAFDEIVPLQFDGLYDARVALRPCGERSLADMFEQLGESSLMPEEHQRQHLRTAIELADSIPAVQV